MQYQDARLPLRDELYLLAHKDNGVPRVNMAGLSLAMACATVIDLILRGRITVHDKMIQFIDGTEVGDVICDQLLKRVRMSARPDRDLASHVAFVAREVYDRTSLHLVLANVISAQARRRIFGGGGESRYRLTAAARTHRQYLTSVLFHTTQVGSKNTDDQRRALCSLVAMLRMERLVQANVSSNELLAQLRAPMAGFKGDEGPAVTEVIAFADERIGTLAVSALGS